MGVGACDVRVDFFVNVKPGRLFLRFQNAGDERQLRNDVLADSSDQIKAFGGDPDKDLSAIVGRVHALDIPEVLEAVNETGRRRGGMGHFIRNLGHGKRLAGGNVTEEEKLWERNLSAGKLLRQVLHEAPLHQHDDVRQTFDFRR